MAFNLFLRAFADIPDLFRLVARIRRNNRLIDAAFSVTA
jgi:hypothetical protein